MLEGEFTHADNKGNSGSIFAGDYQKMTAGNGVIHSEVPGPNGGRGFQMWINLPAASKRIESSYQDRKASDIPTFTSKNDDYNVIVVAGQYHDYQEPESEAIDSGCDYIHKFTALVINLNNKNNKFTYQIPDDDSTAYLYIFEGEASVANNKFSKSTAVIFEKGHENSYKNDNLIEIQAISDETKIWLCHSRPIGEPVSWRGPFVMNTEEEIMETMAMYRSGKKPFQPIK